MGKQGKKNTPVILIAALILVFVILTGGLRILESTAIFGEAPEQTLAMSKTVIRNGIRYFPRQDINVIMFLGIDETGPVQPSNSYNNSGEADVVLLAVLDEPAETCTILALNRDTMTEIPMLGLGGRYAGSYVQQLALAHTYGSGLEDSCENTRKAVSDFLGGISIDYYVSMNMDAVTVLADAVGGVKVTVTEDFSEADPAIPTGDVVLRGAQALNFVQLRKDVGSQLNVTRMERQKIFLTGFLEAFRNKAKEDSGFAIAACEAAAPYLVSDLPVSTLAAMAERYADYEMVAVLSPEGDNVLTGEFCEFHADVEKLEELVLQLFYAKK